MTPPPDHAVSPPGGAPEAPRAPRGGLFRWILDLFSSVRFGIFLMVALFIYMSIGSAGILYPTSWNIFRTGSWHHEQIRQHRLLEMTEFEWFHWWPFDVLMLLIAATLVVTTVRRIRFSVVNLGVWMIHTGIIILIIGSLIYFGTKVEGDAPVSRRVLVLQALNEEGEPVGDEVLLSPFTGNVATVGTGDVAFDVSVLSTDPAWELLSGDDAGKRAYSANLIVSTPEQRFIRQVIDGYPEYTEDLIASDDSNQPFQRAVKVTGNRIVEPQLEVSMRYAPQDWFYLSNALSKNWAMYLRKKGESTWVERPIPSSRPLQRDKTGLPLYNDYVADSSSVLMPRGWPALGADALNVAVKPVSPNDPLPNTTITIDSYLRYAQMQTRVERGGVMSPLNPIIEMELSVDGQTGQPLQLFAMDPVRRSAEAGIVAFRYVDNEEEFESFLEPPTLRIEIPELGVDEVRPLLEFQQDGAWTSEDGDYTIAVDRAQDDLVLESGTVSVVFVDLKTPNGTFRRWVFSDGALTRDVDEEDLVPSRDNRALREESVTITYNKGRGTARLLVVAGPDENTLRLVLALPGKETTVQDLIVGSPVSLQPGVDMVVQSYFPRGVERTAPLIVPASQRHRDMGNSASWARAEAPGMKPVWLRFEHYPFEGRHDLLSRYEPFHSPSPVRIEKADGSWEDVELIFSRQRLRLPAEVALETFELDTNVGGFSGDVSSIRDYRSILRFNDNGTWTTPMPVSMNRPVEHDGLWFFQSQWDPPVSSSEGIGSSSAGLNYTVLGVGNRNGVYVQLLGCVIAVVGMIYAFYVKPMIKRNRQRRVHERLAKESA